MDQSSVSLEPPRDVAPVVDAHPDPTRSGGPGMILAPELGVVPAEEPVGPVPGWLQQFPFPGGPRLVIVVTGDADLSTSAQLRDQLGAAVSQAPEQLVVDVSDVSFVDLSGLDVLYDAARAALGLGVTVTVRGLSPLLWWMHGLLRSRQVPVE